PNRPEAQCGAEKDECRTPEHAALEGAIQPSSDERANYSRRDDGPTEPPHHRERAAHRPFSCPQPLLAPAVGLLDRLFQFAFLGRQLMTVRLLLVCHDSASRLFRRLRRERSVSGTQVTIDLPNRGVFKAEHSRSGSALGLDVLPHRDENFGAQMCQVIVYDRLPGCYLDDLALANAQHAATYGDIVLAAAIAPSHHTDRKRSKKFGMAGFDTKGAAGIFGANVTNGTFIKHDRRGGGDD